MQKQYSESVISALLSADGNGEIRIPPGSPSEIEDLTAHLMELETMGFFTRAEGVGYYRPFILTEHGEKLRSFLAKSENLSAIAA